jgi:UDP-glucose 4-epimerase
MKVLVLGGSGFIGSHIVDIFLRNSWEVTVFDKGHEIFRVPNPKVKLLTGDFSNRVQLSEVISLSFDVIVHCISSTTPKTSNDDPKYDISSNLIETVNLLDICVAQQKPIKIIYISSGGTIYGESHSDSHSENDLKFPICSYAITKIAIENYLYMYHKLYNLNYTTLRISNPFGPRQNPNSGQGAVAVFANRILNRKPIEIWGNGENIRDFVPIVDVANSCYLAALSPKTGTFNIGSGVGLSLIDLVGKLEKITGMRGEIVFLKQRALDIKRIVLNCNLAKEELKWVPLTGFDDALVDTVEWLKSVNNIIISQAKVPARSAIIPN